MAYNYYVGYKTATLEIVLLGLFDDTLLNGPFSPAGVTYAVIPVLPDFEIDEALLTSTNPITIVRKSEFGDFNKLTITADNTDTALLSGVPEGAKARFYNTNNEFTDTTITVTGGDITIKSPVPCIFNVILTHTGYIRKEYKVNAV